MNFTPEKENCSTPFVGRKPFADIKNNDMDINEACSLQYFTPAHQPTEEREENWHLNSWDSGLVIPPRPPVKRPKPKKESSVDVSI